MELIHFNNSPLSLLPPVLALLLVILTRRILISLGIGIIVGALLLTGYNPSDSALYIWNKVSAIFISDGALNMDKLAILFFLILLGILTAFLTISGGAKAFASLMQQYIKSRRGAQVMTAFLGVFIFIDDYFNALAVGVIARPVTDKLKVSRAKLAYILDSTAAPICVLMPASSWGAYIITTIGGILAAHQITEYTPIGAFLLMIPMNFYAIFAIIMVFAVAIFQLDVFAMRKKELEAMGSVQVKEEEEISSLEEEEGLIQSDKGKVRYLVFPIIAMVLATASFMLLTGYSSLASNGQPFSFLGAFENTNVGYSLCGGGFAGVAMALFSLFQLKLSTQDVGKATIRGTQSMFGAILILLMAWTIGSVIGDMETGKYLSSLVDRGNLNPLLLPAILFFLSFCMALATGTSWGTFGIMLPIAGDLAASAMPTLILPMLAAVLAGAVCGDHCSPMSDTTILSSTGARCNFIDHVSTQMPYVLIIAAITTISYLILGFSNSVMLALSLGAALLVMTIFFIRQWTILLERKKS